MGLSAWVPCDCWERGLTTEPPVPRGAIWRDCNGFLTCDGEEGGNVLSNWDPCEHHGLHASERIAGYTWVTDFITLLNSIEGRPFPTLASEIGGSMKLDYCGLTPAERSPTGLVELDAFRMSPRLRAKMITNAQTGVPTILGSPIGDLFFEPMFDANDLVLKDRATGELAFQSKRFRYTEAGKNGVLTDLLTNREWVSDVHWFAKSGIYEVGEQSIEPAQHEEITTLLDKVFRASASFGRPIYWN